MCVVTATIAGVSDRIQSCLQSKGDGSLLTGDIVAMYNKFFLPALKELILKVRYDLRFGLVLSLLYVDVKLSTVDLLFAVQEK